MSRVGLDPVVRLHADELVVDEALVRALVAEQLPDRKGDEVRGLPVSGSSNALFRVGDELLVRLPRQPGGSATILKEARWLPYLSQALSVAVPEIVTVGEPGHGYPERWLVVRWIPREHPTRATFTGRTAQDQLARDLAGLLLALRELEIPSAGRDEPALQGYRGGLLTAIDADIRGYAEQCRDIPGLDLDVDAVLRVWDDAISEGTHSPSRGLHWLHGDLLAENILARDGRLAAVLDLVKSAGVVYGFGRDPSSWVRLTGR